MQDANVQPVKKFIILGIRPNLLRNPCLELRIIMLNIVNKYTNILQRIALYHLFLRMELELRFRVTSTSRASSNLSRDCIGRRLFEF